jgi:hypothetical protein
MAALLSGSAGSGGNVPSVPTSVIQAPSTASPISSGGGSPSGGEDNYFNELYNLGIGGGVGGGVGGGYSGQPDLESPHRRKKMKKQRNPDGPDGCPSGKRKNREGNNKNGELVALVNGSVTKSENVLLFFSNLRRMCSWIDDVPVGVSLEIAPR